MENPARTLIDVAVFGVPAVAVYLLGYFGWYWQVPRRTWRRSLSLAVCLAGSILVGLGAEGLGSSLGLSAERWWVSSPAAFLGALVFFFITVKVGTPGHVGVVVTCDSISTLTPDDRDHALRRRMKKYRLHLPTGQQAAWPEFFYVGQEGSVTWYLYGKPGTEVMVRFGLTKPEKKYYDPFTEEPDNPALRSEFKGIIPAPPAGFEGRVPGVIVAAPVVNPGRGDYEIEIKEPGQSPVILDPTGGGPKKGG